MAARTSLLPSRISTSEAALALVADALGCQDWERARSTAHAVLAAFPDCAAAYQMLALSQCGLGRYDAAAISLERAVALDSAQAFWRRDLAAIYARLGRWVDAIGMLDAVLGQVDPPAVALFLAAAIHAGQAEYAVERLIETRGVDADANPAVLCEYGRALDACGRTAEAERVFLQAQSTHGDSAAVHRALASLYHRTGRSALALDHAEALVALTPQSASALMVLAVADAVLGHHDESRAARRRAVAAGIKGSDTHTAIRLMLFDERESPASILAASRSAFDGVATRHVAPRRRRLEPLRVGYLSGEFRATPAFYFLPSFLTRHDPARIAVFMYHNAAATDACTAAYQRCAAHWRNVAAATDDEVLRMIDDDRLDVLVDLSGHHAGNRLSVFARRAVAAQATFPNCPSTTGCPAVDYCFTDSWTSPCGTDREYSERLYRLASGYLVYSPPPGIAEPVMSARSRSVTFGVVQQTSKLSATMWDLFAEILRRTPGSQLLLHNADADLDRPNSEMVARLRLELERRGIDGRRMRCIGPRHQIEHFSVLGEIDVALDTSPYNGQTTTCECVWAGTPVITWSGSTHAARVGGALLNRAGLNEFVTTSAERYVTAAVRLAEDADARNVYRRTLRERFVASGLTDGTRLARELENAYAAFAATG